ncbi:ead/Ea22-like family protein [Salmonella enterica]|nr:ead/Ea22-like family protein [Salmonella enterica]EBS7216318.1 ead/Ea22-like family protein [Salmonella enterica]EIP1464088.1 ead/Ea22-like family protein [Salmonella enterica]
MSNIDKQALRQIAESVDREEWDVLDNGDADYQVIVSGSLERGPTYRSYQPVTNEISNKKIAAFIAAFNPKVALALLDENLQLQREKDATEAVALALRDDMRQAREKLEAAERSMAEQSAIVAAAEKLVRCKGRYHSELNYRALAKLFGVITPDLPPLVHENVHYADAAEVEITALRQRIAELEAKLETADKLQDSAFRDGLKAGFSYGQTDDQSGFTQCMSAYSTHAGIKREGE